MKNTKTQKEQFVEVIEVLKGAERTDLVDFIQGRIDALAKKASAKKPTKEQKANEVIKSQIVDLLSGGDALTIGEIQKSVPEFADLASQKITALVSQLVKADVLVRGVRDKKAVFSLAEDTAEDEEPADAE